MVAAEDAAAAAAAARRRGLLQPRRRGRRRRERDFVYVLAVGRSGIYYLLAKTTKETAANAIVASKYHCSFTPLITAPTL